MREPVLVGVTTDQVQRRRLHIPKKDVRLGDGRSLRRILGYDLSKVPLQNEVTRQSFLESGGWQHQPTSLLVSAGVEDTEKWGPLLHVSLSYPDHDPTWEEIKLVRAAFFPPQIDAMILLPRASNYINIHPHCFHLWQCMEHWNIG